MATSTNTWIKNARASHLVCRDLSHAWEPLTARRTPTGFERTLECGSCGTLKVQSLDKQGFIIKTRMRYDASYLRPKGAGPLTRDDKAKLRLAVTKEI